MKIRILLFFSLFFLSFSPFAQKYKLVKDINTTPKSSYAGIISNVVSIENINYFFADTYNYGSELWKTQGDSSTTFFHKDIVEGELSSYLQIPPPAKIEIMVLNDTLFTYGEGGEFVYKISKNGSVSKMNFKAYGKSIIFKNALFFNTFSGLGKYENGKTSILNNNLSPSNFCECNNTLYFTGYNSSYGYELWKTDGSSIGTTLVKDIIQGSTSSEPFNLTCGSNGKIYFWAYDGVTSGRASVFVSDGTAAGTKIVEPIGYTSRIEDLKRYVYLKPFKDSLFFVSNYYLYKSDGTIANTVKLSSSRATIRTIIGYVENKLIVSGFLDNTPYGLISYENGKFTFLKSLTWDNYYINVSSQLNNKLIFVANDINTGVELWVTDGTPQGTSLLKDINPGSKNSEIVSTYVANGLVYFGADNGLNGIELWRTDGTSNGTILVKDIDNGTMSSVFYYPTQTYTGNTGVTFKNNLYFGANTDNLNGALFTTKIKPIDVIEKKKMSVTGIVGDSLMFYKMEDSLIVTNGSQSIKVMHPSDDYYFTKTIPFSSNIFHYEGSLGHYSFNLATNTFNQLTNVRLPQNTIKYNNSYYYSGENNSNRELYKTNLNNWTTQALSNSNFNPLNFIIYKDTLYFSGILPIIIGSESNLSHMFLRIVNESTIQNINSNLAITGPFIEYKNKLYFSGYTRSCNRCGENYGLYTYDSQNGVKPFYIFSYNTNPYYQSVGNFTIANNILYFTAFSSSNGTELWRTNGNLSDTYIVKDINVGINSSTPSFITNLNDKLIFVADDGLNGKEFWQSDGTQNGTIRLTNITELKEDPKISTPIIKNGRMFFFANDMKLGRELWMYDFNLCESLKSGYWNDSTVWSCGIVPSVLNDVKVVSPHKIILNQSMGNQSIQSIEVQKGATFDATGIFSSKSN